MGRRAAGLLGAGLLGAGLLGAGLLGAGLLGAGLLGAGLLGAADLAAAPSAGAAAPRGEPLPTLGVLVGKTFLQAVVDRDAQTALPLCAAKVDFDGEGVRGKAAVRKRLGQMFARLGNRRRLRRVLVMTLAKARRRFGPPPARLNLPKGNALLVAFGRFSRGGLVAFLARRGDHWRVIALTD